MSWLVGILSCWDRNSKLNIPPVVLVIAYDEAYISLGLECVDIDRRATLHWRACAQPGLRVSLARHAMQRGASGGSRVTIRPAGRPAIRALRQPAVRRSLEFRGGKIRAIRAEAASPRSANSQMRCYDTWTNCPHLRDMATEA